MLFRSGTVTGMRTHTGSARRPRVPLVPGYHGEDQDLETFRLAAERIGPVLSPRYARFAELANAMRQDNGLHLAHACPRCHKAQHEAMAAFCSRCGSALYPAPAPQPD